MLRITPPTAKSLIVRPHFRELGLGEATGFVAVMDHSRYLITNRHVVRGRNNNTNVAFNDFGAVPDRINIYHHVAGKLGSWKLVSEDLRNSDGEPLWLEHPTHGGRVDVVALPLTETDGLDFYAYDPFTVEHLLDVGISRTLFAIGFPLGVRSSGALPVWVQGTVASEPDFDYCDLPSFLIDSRTRRGQSGSPVIAYHAGGAAAAMEGGGTAIGTGPMERFVGVYSGRISQESDLGIVWKASAVADILRTGVRGTD
jgi:hypothetical protein